MDKSPDAFRTISEVAEALETPAHVLRFWESRFTQIRPVKRAGGRRYYRPADVALLTGIKHLLHDEGMTIRGVQKILREQGVRHVSGTADETSEEADDAALEAALAASGGSQDTPSPLPPAEAETAQIIALQTALNQPNTGPRAELRPAERPAAEEDMFARLASTPELTEERSPEEETELSQEVGTGSSSDEASYEEPSPESAPPDAPPSDEAPMAVWAEPEPPAESDQPTSAATLKITHIGVAARAPEPVGSPAGRDAVPADIARRLRATHAADLSASDRATLSILRAKARSLRDRLGSQPRTGG